MPDFTYHPPSKQTRTPTQPKPFHLHQGGNRQNMSSPTSDDDIECAKQFHARPMPDFTHAHHIMDQKASTRQFENKPSVTPTTTMDESMTQILKRKREEDRELRIRIYKEKRFVVRPSHKLPTVPKPFALSSLSRHEAAQSSIRERQTRESEEIKRRTRFMATPLPKVKETFVLRQTRKSPVKPIEHQFKTETRAIYRGEFEKQLEERKKEEEAMKKLREQEMARKEERKLKKLRRTPVSKGGLWFKAKPFKFTILKMHERDGPTFSSAVTV